MSLLIPTKEDYVDAHGDVEQEKIYSVQFSKIRDEKNENGNMRYPWSFEVVNGFFRQSDPLVDDLNFNYATEDMGRLKSWDDIVKDLEALNNQADNNVSYKLLFLARHGQGYHNVIAGKYGLDAWREKWHALTTDGEIVYAPDPELTELGLKQAEENRRLWKQQMEKGAPLPAKFYVSPLQRSCYTLLRTWDGIRPPDKKPVIAEAIRETIGKNLCDKRSTKTVIANRFEQYGYVFLEPFTEEDLLFTDERETLSEQGIRINGFLQFLFDEDWSPEKASIDKSKRTENIFISTTSHAGTIRAFILALGHRKFTISTGGMIPIVVKATRRNG